MITCLFGAIAYSKTSHNLEKAVNGFYTHLKPGSILIIDRWYDKNQWIKQPLGIGVYESNGMKIIRIGYNTFRRNIAIFEEHYFVAEDGKRIRHFSDRQQFGFFDVDKFIHILNHAGFSTKIMKSATTNNYRYVATKLINL